MIRYKQWYDLKAMTPEERRLYSVWRNIQQRCYSKGNPNYHRYGGTGITMHPEWRVSFEAFIEGVGIPPNPHMDLDRYPNNAGNYEPGNVRWATHQDNLLNARNGRFITINGVTKNLSEWARESGIDKVTIFSRLKMGWTGERLLSPPRSSTYVTINGVEKTAFAWARECGMTTVGFMHRVKQGLVGEDLIKPSQKMRSGPRKKPLQSQAACVSPPADAQSGEDVLG
jgi:hypothetical protein